MLQQPMVRGYLAKHMLSSTLVQCQTQVQNPSRTHIRDTLNGGLQPEKCTFQHNKVQPRYEDGRRKMEDGRWKKEKVKYVIFKV